MHRVLAFGLVAVLAFSLIPSASAQEVTLSGQVMDQHGQPVAGATVTLSQWADSDVDTVEECSPDGTCRKAPGPETYHGGETTTDADGRFSLSVWDRHGSLSVWKDGHAQAWVEFKDASQPLAIELLRFPDKTAHIEGTVSGAGAGLPGVMISIENPLYGTYECSVREGQSMPVEPDGGSGGASPPSDGAGSDGQSASSDGQSASDPAQGNTSASLVREPYPGWGGCAITVHDDGSFDGMVTPGYSIIRFWHYAEQGPEYYGVSRVMDLAADKTTRIDIQLTARPGPDAVLGGHVIDKASQKGIPGAQVSFSSQDAYGWASAQTDKDGSYQVKLRSGYVQIHVWADGYLPWEGQVTVRSGAEGQRFVIELTEGQARYGGCCYLAADGVRTLEGAAGEKASAPGAPSQDMASQDDMGAAAAFQDLGGGLGPYEAAKQDQQGVDGNGAPGFEAVALGLGLLAVALVVRRR